MTSFHVSYKILIFVALLFYSSSTVLAINWFAITPWNNRAFGYLNITSSLLENDSTNESISASSFGGQLQLDSQSHGYIYRPWVAQFDVLAGLFTNSQQFNLETLEEQTLQQIKLDLSFSLFERRDYPIIIEIKNRYDEMSGITDTTNEHQEINLYGSYALEDKNSQLSYSYRDHTEQSTLDQREHQLKTVDLNWYNYGEKNKWSANVIIQKQSLAMAISENESQLQNTSSDTGIFTLGHAWTSDSSSSVTSMLTFSQDTMKYQQSKEDNQRIQMTSFAILRDNDDPRIRYTINMLADVIESTLENSETIESNNIKSENIVINGGMFFDINDNWLLSGNLSTLNSRIEGVTKNTSNAFAGLLYDEDWQINDNSYYNLSVNNQLRIENNDQIEKTSNQVGTFIDHSISWDKQLANSSLSLAVSQQLSDQFGGDSSTDSQKNSFGHRASINWYTQGGGSDSYVQLSFTDMRHWSDNPELFQQINLQVSRRENLSEVSGWHANVSAQWTRSLDIEANEVTNSVVTGNVGYTNRSFFGIPYLFIRSDIHFPIDKLSFNDGKRSNERTNWRTEIIYSLGLLEARSEIILTDDSKYIRLEIRRAFNMF